MRPLSCIITAVALWGVSSPPSANAQASPLIGVWAVDVARLPIPAEARPQRVTITFAEAGSGRLATRVEVVDAQGARMHAEGTTALDGTPAAVTGNLEADVSATTMPIPQVLVMQLAKQGVPASTRVYTVAADGESMVETAAYVGSDGKPIMRTNYFARVK